MAVARKVAALAGLDPEQVRGDFPLLREAPLAAGLHYLDNAATTHKPQAVLDAMVNSYACEYGPIHRGLYPLAEAATCAYEQARQTLARFLGAASAEEIVFTRSATEAINQVAFGWAWPRLRPGERIWVSRMEHHANYLPWQRVCRETGADLRIIEIDAEKGLDLAGAAELFSPQTRLIAVTHVSNVLGVENPLPMLCAEARAHGIPVLVDAAQSVSHVPVDISELGCDFLACSAHKMYGPAGIGLLYVRSEHLAEMQPLLVGGGMVDTVGEGVAQSHWSNGPARFEAGSPNLPGAVGFAAAADFLNRLDRVCVQAHLAHLSHMMIDALSVIRGLHLVSPSSASAIVSFTLDGVHPHDLAQIAGERGVAIRAGHHCAQPLMRSLGLSATARASLAVYNDSDDIQALVAAIDEARHLFA